MAYPFRNLVFEGGGMKGIAYVGALQVLEEKNILPQIVRVGGTSAGAITAVMVGLNYTPAEIWDAVSSMDFGKFMDDDFGLVRDLNRLVNEFGWYKGNAFRKWIGEVIAQKTGNSEATFLQVQQQKAAKGFRDMYFMGTNISTHFGEVFSYEHTPACASPTPCASPCPFPCFSRHGAVPVATSTWTAACSTTIPSRSSTASAISIPRRPTPTAG